MATTYDELKQEVIDNGGVLTVEMGQLRDIQGAGKLGVNVINEISGELDEVGLGHFPQSLPSYQHANARVYLKRSPVGKLLRACYSFGNGCDDLIKGAVNKDAASKIQKIKELIEA